MSDSPRGRLTGAAVFATLVLVLMVEIDRAPAVSPDVADVVAAAALQEHADRVAALRP
ncbi:hypothetical protein [Methylopila sp. 73B]|uniref:hypothetical protein n=1 Tax=Methylopila sp. 73B TaxID=1120792 RepID=UPI000366F15B|nr:hypothetical protein [Methylopila sp. 73B]